MEEETAPALPADPHPDVTPEQHIKELQILFPGAIAAMANAE